MVSPPPLAAAHAHGVQAPTDVLVRCVANLPECRVLRYTEQTRGSTRSMCRGSRRPRSSKERRPLPSKSTATISHNQMEQFGCESFD
eukprot:gene696-biopygen18163